MGPRRRSTRKLYACFADPHGWHKLGLYNPETVLWQEKPLPDGQGTETVPYTPEPTETQAYLWEQYTGDINNVRRLAGRDPIALLVGGDLTHGGTKYVEELMSTRLSDQVAIALAFLRPWLKLPNLTGIGIVQGTAAHNLGEGTVEELVVGMLREIAPKLDIENSRHGLIDNQRDTIDFAHHGPTTGIRKWLKGNVARRYALSLMQEELLAGRVPPRVILRAHRHEYLTETVRILANKPGGTVEYTSDLIILPSYCGLSDHGQQVQQSPYLIHSGVVVLEFVDGRFARKHVFCRSQDLRVRWKL